MRKIRKYLLALSLLAGVVTGTSAKNGPYDLCNVNTRLELDLMCDPATPICCTYITTTRLLDTNEIIYAGTYIFGWYIPIG